MTIEKQKQQSKYKEGKLQRQFHQTKREFKKKEEKQQQFNKKHRRHKSN